MIDQNNESNTPKRSVRGGSIATGGFNYQHRVAAWASVLLLAEQNAALPWDLPSTVGFSFLQCETGQPIDDLLIGTTANGFVFAQVKRTLKLSEKPDSEFASAIDQLVRQVVAYRGQSGQRPWERPLDPTHDRLVLVIGPDSPQNIRVHLATVLQRIRQLVPGQSIEDASANNQQKYALTILLAQVKQAWKRTCSTLPTNEELQHLLMLIYLEVLDIDSGGVAEREAKQILRSSVLQEAEQTDLAWSHLIKICAEFAASQSGGDRVTLLQRLLDADIGLRVSRSYEADVAQLKQQTTQTIQLLTHLSQLYIGKQKVKIRRPHAYALEQASLVDSLLVVGEPGVGKSGALYDLVVSLLDQHHDVLFLAAEHLSAGSYRALGQELGLQHDVVDVLAHWPGTNPAVFVIDALDAARSPSLEQALRDVIRLVIESNGRWRVIVSIRKFDLRWNQTLRQMFVGKSPTTWRDSEFERIRHINIPLLTDDEFAQISTQSSELGSLIAQAVPELRDLLRVPFNVRLIAELLGEGFAVEELTPIRTQLELLDRYWLYRLLKNDGQADARETVLRSVCDVMIQARALRADRSRVANTTTSAALADLLHNQVLLEWQSPHDQRLNRDVLTFSHHVLFDYAVERLLFRGDPRQITKRMEQEPDLILMIQPSFVLHFRHLWTETTDQQLFWQLVMHITTEEGVPYVAKLIGPAIVAEAAKILTDLTPLMASLNSSDEVTQTTAETVLRSVIGALLAGRGVLVGEAAGPWAAMLEHVTQALRPTVGYAIRPLLITMCVHPVQLTSEQQVAVGAAARRLLTFAWEQTPRDSSLVINSLQAVCRTFRSDPEAAATLLRRCLEPTQVMQHGFEEIPQLAKEVTWLLDADPEFVAILYIIAFTYIERSTKQTSLGNSRILGLLSTRAQDYGLAQYMLGEAFPKFLNTAPIHALFALVKVMEAYIVQRSSYSLNEGQEHLFDFGGQEARIIPDFSSMWYVGERHEEPALKMIGEFTKYLTDVSRNATRIEHLHELVEVVVRNNRLAVLWRQLLIVGSSYPETLGYLIRPLAWSFPVLVAFDTSPVADTFLAAIYPLLAVSEREQVEQAILAIPDSAPSQQRHAGERIRDRLILSLSIDLVTERAQTLRAVLEQSEVELENNPSDRIVDTQPIPYSGLESLSDEGVPVAAEANQHIRDLESPVQAFVDSYRNISPPYDAVATIVPVLQALYEALSKVEGVHTEQHRYAWTTLAEGCAKVATTPELDCAGDVGAFIRQTVLEAGEHPDPAYYHETDTQFDTSLSWSPAVRIAAASGVIALTRHALCVNDVILSTIRRLSVDPAPPVRLQIIAHITALELLKPDLMWQIVEHVVHHESSRGIVRVLVEVVLPYLARSQPDRVVALMIEVFERIIDGPGVEQVREACVELSTDQYVWHNQAECKILLERLVDQTPTYARELLHVLHKLRRVLKYGSIASVKSLHDEIRGRAIGLLRRVLKAAQQGLHELELAHQGMEIWPEASQEQAKSLLNLIESIGREVYFASGAFDETNDADEVDRGDEKEVVERRFYQEAADLIDILADLGYPTIAHHMVETLEHCIPFDPRGVFLRIGRVVCAGQKGGYQFESIAVDEIVSIVERYLAEYRALLREDEVCRRTLLEILNIFVQVGWPSAQRLTYRLEDIFR